MDLLVKKEARRSRKSQGGVRPSGSRGRRMLRFAEADTASASAFRLCASNTALARKGLAVFQALCAFRRARPQTCIFSKTSLFGGVHAIW